MTRSVYRASSDWIVLGVTIPTVVLLLGVGAWLGYRALVAQAFEERMVMGVIATLCISILVVSWILTPRGYRLEDQSLFIERPIGDVEVPLRQVADARADHAPLAGTWRLAGNGGLFGIWGKYRDSRVKKNVTVYATRLHEGVVLTVEDRTVVISPDEPERFVAELKQRLPRPAA